MKNYIRLYSFVVALCLSASLVNASTSAYLKKSSLGFSKAQKVSLNFKSIQRRTGDGTSFKSTGRGLSYFYGFSSSLEAGFEFYSAKEDFSTGQVSMQLEYLELLPTLRTSIPRASKNFKLALGLGLMNEKVSNSIGSSTASGSEWRPIYSMGLNYSLALGEIEGLQKTILRNMELDFGMNYRGEFEATNTSFIDLKVLGLGYRF